MTIQEALASAPIETLDAEVLLALSLGKNRTWIVGHSNDEIDERAKEKFEAFVRRRQENEPISYITGVKEFYGREFMVNPSVLIPRPATEELVRMTMEFCKKPLSYIQEIDSKIIGVTHLLHAIEAPRRGVSTIIDVGTGSGCIAITLALENPDLHIVATDSSYEALNVAVNNARKFGVAGQIDFRCEDHFESLSYQEEQFVVVSNPPYIPEDEVLMPDVGNFEPRSALFSGEEGTDMLSALTDACKESEHCVGWVIECKSMQKSIVHP